jgi:dihydroorotase
MSTCFICKKKVLTLYVIGYNIVIMTDLPLPVMTCKNCAYYKSYQTHHMPKAVKQCEGLASEYVEANASDDTGLESWFRPPANFYCSGWAEK